MSGGNKTHRLTASLGDPVSHESAVQEIAQAFAMRGGIAERVAEYYGVHSRTVRRWIREHDELERQVAAIRRTHGARHDEYGSATRPRKQL